MTFLLPRPTNSVHVPVRPWLRDDGSHEALPALHKVGRRQKKGKHIAQMELEQHVAVVRKKGGMILAIRDRLFQDQRCPDHVNTG
jgi:hypothetical protein